MNAETREYAKRAISEVHKERAEKEDAFWASVRRHQHGKRRAPKPKGPNGRPPLVKLSDSQIEEIWRLYCAGKSLRDLAAFFAPIWKVTEKQGFEIIRYRFARAEYKLRSPREGLLNWATAVADEADRRVEGEAA